MPNNQLIQWIKSKEAQGYSDSHLKTQLKKRGWPEKDIGVAIRLAHKGKVNWMPLLLLFFVPLLIFGILLESKEVLNVMFILGIPGIILVSLYSYVIYRKSNRQEDPMQLFILNFAAFFLSLSIALFLFNFITMFVYLLEINSGFIFLGILLVLGIITFYFSFVWLVYILSKHFKGYFNAEAYFVFKRIPFKFFNARFNKKWTFLKVPIFIILLGIIAVLIFFSVLIDSQNDRIPLMQSAIQEQAQFQLWDACGARIFEKLNLTIVGEQVLLVQKHDSGFYYDEELVKDSDSILFECDLDSYTCKEKEFLRSMKLEAQIDLSGEFTGLKIIKTPKKKFIIETSDYVFDELLSCPIFDKNLRSLKIAQEYEIAVKERLRNLVNLQLRRYSLLNFVDVLRHNQMASRKSSHLSIPVSKVLAIRFEAEAIKNNSNGKLFYDGTTDIDSHIQELSNNVQGLFPLWEKYTNMPFSSPHYQEREVIDYLFSFSESTGYLVEKSWKISDIHAEVEDISRMGIREDIRKMYEERDISESTESKSIRLKMLEIILGKEILASCTYNHKIPEETRSLCREKVEKFTSTPEMIKR